MRYSAKPIFTTRNNKPDNWLNLRHNLAWLFWDVIDKWDKIVIKYF